MPQAITWHKPEQLTHLPYEIRHWLLDERSLTAKLVQHSNQHFCVERIRQDYRVPNLSERSALHLRHREIALNREVFLKCHDKPWVYAKTVIPERSLHGPLRYLNHLNSEALGSFLFKYPNLKRSHFQLCQIALPHQDIPYTDQQTIYGRRSVFYLFNSALLVSEFFLPNCPFYHTA